LALLGFNLMLEEHWRCVAVCRTDKTKRCIGYKVDKGPKAFFFVLLWSSLCFFIWIRWSGMRTRLQQSWQCGMRVAACWLCVWTRQVLDRIIPRNPKNRDESKPIPKPRRASMLETYSSWVIRD
jgi:hypothetical protein